MSVPNKSVELSPEAQADFTSILLYSLERWGDQQMDAYNGVLLRALATIEANPGVGRTREDIRPGLRSFPVHPHLIYYRIKPTAIRVERILHARMDAATQIKE